MLTKQELADLRKGGVSDDEILTGFREYDRTHDSDIGGLLKDGVKSGAILDGLTDFRAEPKADAKAETWGDTAKNFGKAAQYGVASIASGVGKTLEASGYDNVGPYIDKVGKKIAPADYVPASSKFEFSSPSTYGYIPRALVEGAPGAVVDIGGGLVGGAAGALAGGVGAGPGFVAGFTGAHTARSYGDALEDRLKYQGKTLADATGKDQAIALASTAGEGALGAVGVKGLPVAGAAEAALAKAGLAPALGSVTKGAGVQAVAQIPGQVAGAAVREGASGAAGNLVQQTGRTIDTPKGLDISANELANSGALSAGGGAGLRAVRGVGDVYQSTRMRGLMEDPESSTRIADAIVKTSLDPSDPKQANDAIRLVEGQLHRSTKGDDIKALLKGSDGEARTAVNDALDRLRKGYELAPDQLQDIKTRFGNDPAGQSLVQAVTDLSTLQRVKGLGQQANGTFQNPGASGSLLGRVTNPLNRLTVGAGAAGGAAAYAVPAIAQSAALANLIGAAPAVIGGAAAIQGGLRGVDALLGTRRPLDQFTRRFSGFDPGETAAPAALPAYAARPDVDPNRVDAQTDRSWTAHTRLMAREQAENARREAEADRAWASREEAPEARARQEDAMWKAQETEQARSHNEDTTAQEGIAEGYRALLARAEAAQNMRAQQEAQARAQADRQNAQTDAASVARSRAFDRAEAQRPAEISDTLKARQIAAAYKAQAAQEAAQGQPRGWDNADSIAAIREAQARAQADSDAVLRRNSIERAAANPIPVDEVVTAQPKAQTKAKAEAPKAKAKDDSKSKKQNEGDSFDLDGITHPIPDNVYNRAGYIKSIKRKQGQIDSYIRKAQDDGFISEKTDNAISDLRDELKTARSKKQARQTVERIAKQASESDRGHILRTFDDAFLGIWSKDE